MTFSKVVIIGGGVLGAQIALMSAYTGHDTTLWLRSERSIGRTASFTKEKIVPKMRLAASPQERRPLPEI